MPADQSLLMSSLAIAPAALIRYAEATEDQRRAVARKRLEARTEGELVRMTAGRLSVRRAGYVFDLMVGVHRIELWTR
jgi:hypothetical protein